MLQAAAEAIVESPTEITSDAAAVSFNLVTQVQEMAVAFAPRLGAAIGVFILFLIGGKLLMKIIHRMGRSNRIDDELSNFLGRSAKVGMLLFGAVSALGTLGIDIGALIAGLGLTGFALGFAFKDTISNLLAGIMVIIYKPFDLDDIILVGKFEGRVRSIDLRYTVLDYNDRIVYVPNAKLFIDSIVVDDDGKAAAAEAEAAAAAAAAAHAATASPDPDAAPPPVAP
jgi:small conductance mechanosensitive channel